MFGRFFYVTYFIKFDSVKHNCSLSKSLKRGCSFNFVKTACTILSYQIKLPIRPFDDDSWYHDDSDPLMMPQWYWNCAKFCVPARYSWKYSLSIFLFLWRKVYFFVWGFQISVFEKIHSKNHIFCTEQFERGQVNNR